MHRITPGPSLPVQQTPQHRSFRHTWLATGDSDTVAIPGDGMADVSYSVHAMIEDVPAGGSVAVLYAPSATKTTSEFVLQSSGPLLIGTTLDVTVRDN